MSIRKASKFIDKLIANGYDYISIIPLLHDMDITCSTSCNLMAMALLPDIDKLFTEVVYRTGIDNALSIYDELSMESSIQRIIDCIPKLEVASCVQIINLPMTCYNSLIRACNNGYRIVNDAKGMYHDMYNPANKSQINYIRHGSDYLRATWNT